MIASPVQTGFRTLRHAPAPRERVSSFPDRAILRVPRREAVWSFGARVRDADAVFLVLSEEGRPSRWTEMEAEPSGEWTARLPIAGGVLRATLYVQRGTTMINAGGRELRIRPPAGELGGARVEPAREAWSA
ncbi:hypothetical protein [Phycisphaera mikurensis]|uniref:Uncharacterized protein n=1 Tax=Phycisphaera mikurensis (strain NBRC 102666 / KCTC 22515 / FYK2301M01) TaxID=1142394 RepID=I0IE14_PHYMF|nr:hypothetical protein [Phycisphaera mikurensis]MBB6441309.1 hypothetical protein [Phycisphaera mikurensis]BAM03502.1 hypothetical protein PSMK_13430 [Phycisphaera mikurensis NBRC 102666]